MAVKKTMLDFARALEAGTLSADEKKLMEQLAPHFAKTTVKTGNDYAKKQAAEKRAAQAPKKARRQAAHATAKTKTKIRKAEIRKKRG